MSQYPPSSPQFSPGGPAPYSMAPVAPPSNGWGLAALITGLVGGCLPVLGGLLACIFGILGIKRANQIHTGKGMSIAGLILGLISMASWAVAILGFGGMIMALIGMTEAPRKSISEFIISIPTASPEALQAKTEGIDLDELKALQKTVKAWGTCTDVTTASTNVNNNHAELHGVATFTTGGTKSYHADLVQKGEVWKVTSISLE